MKLDDEMLELIAAHTDEFISTEYEVLMAKELVAARALIEAAFNWDAFDQMNEDEECSEIIRAYRHV